MSSPRSPVEHLNKMAVRFTKSTVWIGAVVCLSGLVSGLSTGRSTREKGPHVVDSGRSNIYLTTPELITKYGYLVETHIVTSEDGYLSTLHRIPGSPVTSPDVHKAPVFLQHGIAVASELWICTGPNKGLGFILADLGYDVWLGNARGNFYSRSHVTLSPEDPKFWDFTWHEMGVYDLPAVIDYILATTNQPQLFYVGHSLGCTMFFALTSTRPEYNAKIRLMVAMAPAVYAGQHGSFSETYAKLIYNFGENEVSARTNNSIAFWNSFCGEGFLQKYCLFIYFNTFGYNGKELNTTLMPHITVILNSGSASRVFQHVDQIFEKERFQLFDRGARRRGQVALMPSYNLTQVTAPVSLVYAMNDAVIRPEGVLRLGRELPNVVKITRVPDEEATHVDFAFAINAKKLVYNDIIALMRRY